MLVQKVELHLLLFRSQRAVRACHRPLDLSLPFETCCLPTPYTACKLCEGGIRCCFRLLQYPQQYLFLHTVFHNNGFSKLSRSSAGVICIVYRNPGPQSVSQGHDDQRW